MFANSCLKFISLFINQPAYWFDTPMLQLVKWVYCP